MPDPDEPTDPELEAVLAAAPELSLPPPGATPAGCGAHGAEFIEVQEDDGGALWKVFRDGCKEPLTN